MPRPARRAVLFGAAACALASGGAVAADAPPAPAPRAPRAPPLQPSTTEEGQSVVYDAYTWRRRQLAKRLPLAEPWPGEAQIAPLFRRFGLDTAPVPEAIPVPSQILRDVYLVNSVPNHAYLIDGGADGLALIDPGLEANVEAILKAVEALGFQRRAIRWVINTHAHFDHAQADAHFQRLGAKVLVGRADAHAVEKATQVTGKYVLGRRRARPIRP
jgi:hypothetical protein